MRRHVIGRCAKAIAVLLPLLFAVVAVGPVAADGWHNPVLTLGSVNDWLRDVKAVVPNLDEQLKTSSLRAGAGTEDLKKLAQGGGGKQPASTSKTKGRAPVRGGNLQANLTPQQQDLLARKAGDCLQVLAFMKQGNVIPREFPQFPINKMEEYRQTAKQLLGMMGSPGKEAVLSALTNHLMSGFASASDVSFHPSYVNELLQLLGNAASQGLLTPEDLDSLTQAMEGAKPPLIQKLVSEIDKTLSDTLAFQTLMEWGTETENPKRKSQIFTRLRHRISDASPDELQQALNNDDIDAKTKVAIGREIANVLPELGIAGLLNLSLVEQADLQQAVDRELRSRAATYQNVKGEIGDIWSFANSPQKRVADYARYFVANAFQEAPMGFCLYWLGQGDEQLVAVIWQRLDARISQATEPQKEAFSQTVFKAWEVKELTTRNRKDCLELLGRIGYRGSAKQLVELLLTMPRELLPSAGQSLKSITGQDYGPKAGDGIAEVTVAAKRWREWIAKNDP